MDFEYDAPEQGVKVKEKKKHPNIHFLMPDEEWMPSWPTIGGPGVSTKPQFPKYEREIITSHDAKLREEEKMARILREQMLQLQGLQQQNSNLREQNDDLKEQNKRLQMQEDELWEEIGRLQKQNSDLHGQIKRLQEQQNDSS